MKARFVLLFVIALNTLFATVLLAQDAPPHWTYEGEDGPENWGELGEAYAACGTGQQQSPIDITTVNVDHLPDIEFSYTDSALNILNNGHTIQANYDAGSSIVSDGETYNLAQFHFHAPSEHTIDGESYPMELHFVHRSEAGVIAVVGLMIEVGDADNAGLAPVFDNMPPEASQDGTAAAIAGQTISAASLLPADQHYFTYSGSLTTPPCSEGVKWHVITTPITISQAQFDAYTALYPMTARPLQPINDRTVSLDFGA